MKTMALWPLLLATLTATAAHAQDVWRCGADGRSYSSTPCSEGRLIATSDSRPAADVRAAQAVAARDIALADQLRRERLQEQSRTLRNGTGSVAAAGVKHTFKPEAAAPRRALKAPKHRSAIAGTSPEAARASRRTRG